MIDGDSNPSAVDGNAPDSKDIKEKLRSLSDKIKQNFLLGVEFTVTVVTYCEISEITDIGRVVT